MVKRSPLSTTEDQHMDNKAVMSLFMKHIWNEGREDMVENYVAPQYKIHHDPGDPWHGKTLNLDAFKNRLRVSRAPFPDQCFTTREMIEENNNVAISWLWQGSHLGQLAGIKPTGKMITMSGLTIYYFENGKLSGHWQMADRLGVFQQLSSFSPEQN